MANYLGTAKTYGMKNDKEVQNGMQSPFYEALEYVKEQLKAYNEKMIRKTVYMAYSPRVYERTQEFMDVPWEFEETPSVTGLNTSSKREFRTMFGYFGWDNLTEDEDYAIHSSPEWAKIADVRPYLAEIIYEGKSGSLFGFGGWSESRNAYEALLAQIKDPHGDNKIKNWFYQGLKRHGLKVKKGQDFKG